MDRNSPSYYVEETEQGIEDVQSFVDYVHDTGKLEGRGRTQLNNGKGPASGDLVTPSIIPRFVPSCTSTMMHALGRISAEHQLPVHSHMSESEGEIAWVKQLHPASPTYGHVYHEHGLFHERSYMAHCVHCCPEERALMLRTKAGVVHCPNSNFMLKSGVCNVRQLLNEGIKVGLGTDIAGGCSSSMFDCIRQCIIASRTAFFGNREEAGGVEAGSNDATSSAPINFGEAFYLATLGGAEVLGLKDVVGNFAVGKAMDVLVVDPNVPDSPFDLFGQESAGQIFEKFLFLGDDRNITEVYVNGKCIYAQKVHNTERITTNTTTSPSQTTKKTAVAPSDQEDDLLKSSQQVGVVSA
eukprot:CAMPEP_0185767222 /NCGR_PEP_ID=MMETSP1174-20130828/41832_1 /TAXON_ID=35687 /ORGANISM="Dictyocha speculum, Strain CCMP1381" /LENGTH=353 /DNA_ID=CAMNT_0028451299 /DNA_START=60 /DNA_END=1121 /DNA_ORIENTATION=+